MGDFTQSLVKTPSSCPVQWLIRYIAKTPIHSRDLSNASLLELIHPVPYPFWNCQLFRVPSHSQKTPSVPSSRPASQLLRSLLIRRSRESAETDAPNGNDSPRSAMQEHHLCPQSLFGMSLAIPRFEIATAQCAAVWRYSQHDQRTHQIWKPARDCSDEAIASSRSRSGRGPLLSALPDGV